KVNAYASYAREQQHQNLSNAVNFPALFAALADPNAQTAFNPFGDGSHTNPQTLNTLRTSLDFLMTSELKMTHISADGPIWQLPGGPLKLAVGADRRDQFYATFSPASVSAPASRVNSSRQISAAFAELVAPIVGKDNGFVGLRKLELSLAARYED